MGVVSMTSTGGLEEGALYMAEHAIVAQATGEPGGQERRRVVGLAILTPMVRRAVRTGASVGQLDARPHLLDARHGTGLTNACVHSSAYSWPTRGHGW
jgi:hypothetical protein